MRNRKASATQPAPKNPFKLDVFTVNPMARTLIGPVDRIQVDPKVLEVLIFLAQRAGEVVPHDELLDKAWKGRVVSSYALSRCVYQLRKHFCQAGGSERFKRLLETIPKRGYRLNCDLVPVEIETTIEPAAVVGRKALKDALRHPSTDAAGLVLFLVIGAFLGGGVWLVRQLQLPENSTARTEAFDYYTRANDYFGRTDRQTALPYAETLYRQATEIDPDFKSAWVGLARAHTDIYWHGIEREPARLQKAQEAIDHLFRLGGDLSEAHLAKANFLLKGLNRYEDALIELDEAEKAGPGNPDLLFMRAMAHRRLGDWRTAIEDLDKAIAKDSSNILYLRQQYINFHFLREFEKAEAILDHILVLFPDDGTTYIDKVLLSLCRDGDTTLARTYERNPPSALYDEGLAYTYSNWLVAIFDRNYEKALQILDDASESQIFDGDLRNISFGPKMLFYARTYYLAGDNERASQSYTEVLNLLDDDSIKQSTDIRTRVGKYMALAEARAALDQVELARETVKQARDLIPPSEDALISSALQVASVIRVLIPARLTTEALLELDDYLGKEPGHWSINGLRADPRLSPIIDSREFRDLEAKYGRS